MVMEPKTAGAISNADWAQDEDIADPSPLPIIPGYRLLIRPLKVQGKTKGSILLPDSFKDDINYLTTVGRVLAVGDLAYADKEKFPTGPWCQVGDIVCYGKMNGNKIRYKGVNLIMLYDDQIIMRIEDPSDVDPMFNIAS
jgi:co-chaperonin GroES (HSP10)